MANIGLTARTITLADGTVSGLVGSRMYPAALPQNATLPAIVYHIISTVHNQRLGGNVDVSMATVQMDCYASTNAGSIALAEAVRLALQMKNRGNNSGQFINDIVCSSGEKTGTDPVSAGSDRRRYITSLDFDINYRVAVS